MSTNSLLKQYSNERAALVQSALAWSAAIVIGRKRALSGIRWRDDLIVTAAEAIGGAERVDVRLQDDELTAEVIATDLTTDVAVLRLESTDAATRSASTGSASTGLASAGPASTGPASTGPASADSAPAGPASAGLASAGSASTGPSPTALGSTASASAVSASTHAGTRDSASTLRVGEPIALVGRTLRGPAALWGSVQLAGPAWRSRRGGRIDQRLELDVAFEPSFEGGAVIDMAGNLVAMAVPGTYRRILGIPTTTIEAVVAKVDQFGRLPKPYIGVRLQPLWLDDDTRSKLGRKSRGIAAVGGIDAGSPAEQAHIELGDLLLTVDGEPAESVNGLAHRIASANPGQTIEFEVLRGGKPMAIKVQVGERRRH
jgi:S1-C subfamily serine protease